MFLLLCVFSNLGDLLMHVGLFFAHLRKSIKKLGAFCWLAVAIAIVETLICIKFGRGKLFI